MEFFTKEEFNQKYNIEVQDYQIENACEMIYSQVGLRYRNPEWDYDTIPTPIKNASMEQLRFMLEYEIPTLDFKGEIVAGNMKSNLSTDYSTLALRILANGGYLYRGNPINQNMGMELPF
jgi:hypothetical protein